MWMTATMAAAAAANNMDIDMQQGIGGLEEVGVQGVSANFSFLF
jgi:hypothetical protein